MTYGPESERKSALLGPTLAFGATLVVTLAILLIAAFLQGHGLNALFSPGVWLSNLQAATALDTLSNAAEVVAAVLSIAIMVVAIVVELAANRYSHRITWLFVREPANIVIMSFFVVTTLLCVWVSVTLANSAPDAVLPNAGFAVTMVMVTLSLLILLPYFAFVFAFLSPLSIIRKLRDAAWKFVRSSRRGSAADAQANAEEAIDELQDVARRAIELSDRSVAMASIGAMADLVMEYQTIRDSLPEDWFRLHESVAGDPDFVALSDSVLREIEQDGTWLEVKVMRQYLSLMNQSVPRARDIAYLISIHTKQVGIAARESNPALLELCIQCTNSYLRASINASDPRTTYYLLNQYRKLAEQLLRLGELDRVAKIAHHFQFYGVLGYRMKQPFLLEVAAYDLSQILAISVEIEAPLVDPLLDLLLAVDQEIRADQDEECLLGIRKAQIQIATLFALRGDEARMEKIARELQSEPAERLWQIQTELTAEDRPQYWEFTDRGVNFSYLPTDRRQQLPQVLYWLDQNRETPTAEIGRN